MAVKRIQWVCPRCRRRYAIPETAPTPELCPSCQAEGVSTSAPPSREAPPKPTSPSRKASAVSIETDNPFISEPPPSPRPPQTTPPPQPPPSAAPEPPLPIEPLQFEEPAGPPQAYTLEEPQPTYTRKKYPALQAVSLAYRGLAYLASVGCFLGLLMAVVRAVTDDPSPARTVGIIQGLVIFAGGALSTLTFLAFSELIRLAIDIEENTRRR